MRKDEEHCKSAFDAFLRQRCQEEDIVWNDEDNPPDYYLQLNGNKYAVEVTSLMEVIQLGNESLSHLTFIEAVHDFLKQIEQQAVREGILKGAYVVDYKPLNDFGKWKKYISKNIMDYIHATRDAPSAPERTILNRGHLGWSIEKYHSEKQYLTGATSDARWHHQAVDELCALLNQTLEKKAKKLATISCPKILLIADRYPWLESSDWSGCLSNLNSISEFHTVFLVSERGNSTLHSIESTWLNRL
jgi:hypothetical protein